MSPAGPTYAPDQRTPRDVLAELSRRAAATPLPTGLGTGSWSDLLFDGERLADEREASQSLLLALARLHAELGAHYNTLPARARAHYLEERLGIQRLEPRPDRVIAVVDGDPKRLPASLPRGALLKAGKTRSGGERLFATTEELTVTGTAVSEVGSYREFADRDVAVSRGPEVAKPSEPFHPFGVEGDPEAPHALYLSTGLLDMRGGGHRIILVFDDVEAGGEDALENLGLAYGVFETLRWEIAAPDDGSGEPGYVPLSPDVMVAEEEDDVQPAVRVRMWIDEGVSAPLPLAGAPRHHLRARFPTVSESETFSREAAMRLGFARARIVVEGGPLPEAGYFNEGLLDVTKEFQPFGPAPQRADAFYVRSDEAFGKPLDGLVITFEPVAGAKTTLEAVDGSAGVIEWQRRAASAWETFATMSDLTQPALSWELPPTEPLSALATVGGAEGRFVRGFLSGADFGFRKFQKDVVDAVPKIVRKEDGAKVPTPPDPPMVARVSIGYTSSELDTASGNGDFQVFSRNALGAARELTGDATIKPFGSDPSGFDGAMYLGLAGAPAGEVLAIYFDVDEAAACEPIPDDYAFEWRYRDQAGGWTKLDCVDGTLELRQSGILRFVAPLDWGTGAPEADAEHDHWLRATSTKPGLAGRLTQVRPDAVTAVYRPPPGAGEEAEDPLPPGGITGPRAAVAGIKAVTNPVASWGARGAEPDRAFFRRAAGSLRHRNRAITPWDLERIVIEAFPELERARCLPHHSHDSECDPGWAGLVLVPSVDRDTAEGRLPHPSVLLRDRVGQHVRACSSPHLKLAVLCPKYLEVGVAATLRLRPELSAGPARERIERDLRRFLHPTSGRRFGAPLFRSDVIRMLEEHRDVELASGVDFLGEGAGLERLEVDPCRGLVASAAVHLLTVEAQL